ncbi:MAG: hypothetical protein A3E87_08800 [Gammaproteobacteria bacterium RIFCSPHIGHO2_12_FULL_35_23]|nr:MAG: hypothetical protein A3E87_08800 [Gammaproteobacteria bacterium RIFCSPHIGHO2_12_FULL_35_23]
MFEVFEQLARDSRLEPKPSADQLLSAYCEGIYLYPGARELIHDFYNTGYQVVILTNNSDLGILHTRALLAKHGLECVRVYGSAELGITKPDPLIFSYVCETEKVCPEACLFIDDRKENQRIARTLGITTIDFTAAETFSAAARSISTCRDELAKLGIVRRSEVTFPAGFNRGKYPSLIGLFKEKVVRYHPEEKLYSVIDEPNLDGNQRKRCLYESRLARLIIESGRDYWASAYQKINQLFLADFDLKCDPSITSNYTTYFDKINHVLKKEGLLAEAATYTKEDLRTALVSLFSEPFNLTNVSQFYYSVWLLDYGPKPLEPFVFLVDKSQEKLGMAHATPGVGQSILLSALFPDLAHDPVSRSQAYFLAQPWLTCGPPQLRGRVPRKDAPKPAFSRTAGIMCDDDPLATPAAPHFAAKIFFSPARSHPIAQVLQADAAPVVGGLSGTFGRNIFMLAALVEAGLLTLSEFKQYVMVFIANLIHCGHHSFKEIAIVFEEIAAIGEILPSLKPWFDLLRDPLRFYEQLLTIEFLSSDCYQKFLSAHEGFFEEPVAISIAI